MDALTAPPFLRAEWRWLLMLNFHIDPHVLAPLVPRGTELDDWNGEHYVSMVGFRFLRTSVRGLAIPFHRDFDEINLRFYVRREVGGELRRGVVFVREIVPRRAIAWVARTVYNENYACHPMRHTVRIPEGTNGGEVGYGWCAGNRWHELRARFRGEPVLPGPDAVETFITEHYWGYARQRDGSTVEYRVEHPRWRVWSAASASFDCDVPVAYGPEYATALCAAPHSAFVADGSAVIVRRGAGIIERTTSSWLS